MKHLVFKYGGTPPDEIEFDEHDIRAYKVGDTFEKHGVLWQVRRIRKRANHVKNISAVWIYLIRDDGQPTLVLP
jgi:hypothetical protein